MLVVGAACSCEASSVDGRGSGFRTDNVVALHVVLRTRVIRQRAEKQFFDDLLTRMRAVPVSIVSARCPFFR
jgi:hypothetical protein